MSKFIFVTLCLIIAVVLAIESELGKLLYSINDVIDMIEKHFYTFETIENSPKKDEGWTVPKLDVSNMSLYKSLVNANMAAYCKPKFIQNWTCSFCKSSGLEIKNGTIAAYSDRKNKDLA